MKQNVGLYIAAGLVMAIIAAFTWHMREDERSEPMVDQEMSIPMKRQLARAEAERASESRRAENAEFAISELRREVGRIKLDLDVERSRRINDRKLFEAAWLRRDVIGADDKFPQELKVTALGYDQPFHAPD